MHEFYYDMETVNTYICKYIVYDYCITPINSRSQAYCINLHRVDATASSSYPYGILYQTSLDFLEMLWKYPLESLVNHLPLAFVHS